MRRGEISPLYSRGSTRSKSSRNLRASGSEGIVVLASIFGKVLSEGWHVWLDIRFRDDPTWAGM